MGVFISVGVIFVMFFEKDMRLMEIIKFAKAIIKRNNKIYRNMFLFVAVWSVLFFCMNFVLGKSEDILILIMVILYFFSFAIFFGVGKIIYNSIYYENYSENYNIKDIINYVKKRYFIALLNMMKTGVAISVIAFIMIWLPVEFLMDNETFIGDVSLLTWIAITSFVAIVVFIYYVMEITLNNNVRAARSEVISIFKIKKLKAFSTVIPLSLFTGLLYSVASAVVAIITSNINSFFTPIGVTSTSATMMTNATGPIIFVYCIFLIGFCAITLYVLVLWIIKYYNMKNVIIYKLTNDKNNINSVEHKETKTIINNNKNVGNVGVNAIETTVSMKNSIDMKSPLDNEIIVATTSDVDIKSTSDIVNDVSVDEVVKQERKPKISSSELKKEKIKAKQEEKQEEKRNSNNESNIVGEDSMWGMTVSIEDSIIGRD